MSCGSKEAREGTEMDISLKTMTRDRLCIFGWCSGSALESGVPIYLGRLRDAYDCQLASLLDSEPEAVNGPVEIG